MKREKRTMAVFAKDPTSQLISAVESAAARALSSCSGAPSRVVDLQEARHLSRFVPVLVLVPTSAGEARTTHPKVPELDGQNYSKSRFVQLLNKPSEKPKTRDSEDDFLFGDIRVSFWSMEVNRKGESLILTALEFRTLKYFAQNPRKVISRDELLNEVWGYQNYPCTRTVDNHILRLRQKLEKNPSRPAYFRTVHGCGCKFTP
jgi:Transcriptional regulatory protein, C terminal